LTSNEILVIHDDQSTAEEIRQIVNSTGFKAHLAKNKQRALEIATVTTLRTIIINALLGDVSIIALITELRKIPHLKGTPIILLAETEGVYKEISALSKDKTAYGTINPIKLPATEEELVALIESSEEKVDKEVTISNEDTNESWNTVDWNQADDKVNIKSEDYNIELDSADLDLKALRMEDDTFENSDEPEGEHTVELNISDLGVGQETSDKNEEIQLSLETEDIKETEELSLEMADQIENLMMESEKPLETDELSLEIEESEKIELSIQSEIDEPEKIELSIQSEIDEPEKIELSIQSEIDEPEAIFMDTEDQQESEPIESDKDIRPFDQKADETARIVMDQDELKPTKSKPISYAKTKLEVDLESENSPESRDDNKSNQDKENLPESIEKTFDSDKVRLNQGIDGSKRSLRLFKNKKIVYIGIFQIVFVVVAAVSAYIFYFKDNIKIATVDNQTVLTAQKIITDPSTVKSVKEVQKEGAIIVTEQIVTKEDKLKTQVESMVASVTKEQAKTKEPIKIQEPVKNSVPEPVVQKAPEKPVPVKAVPEKVDTVKVAPQVKTPEKVAPLVKTPEKAAPLVKTPEKAAPLVKTPEKVATEAKTPEKAATETNTSVPEPVVEKAPSKSGANYVVQINMFRSKENAENNMGKLKGLGFNNSFIKETKGSKGTMYIVLVGPFPDSSSGSDAMKKLKDAGINSLLNKY